MVEPHCFVAIAIEALGAFRPKILSFERTGQEHYERDWR